MDANRTSAELLLLIQPGGWPFNVVSIGIRASGTHNAKAFLSRRGMPVGSVSSASNEAIHPQVMRDVTQK
ncbi:hypothetical protein [Caballeronia terrestris]|uniref:hypothetical protein n=1 Tax=Caballeronia terrestris TaxID=1226301 RepID=UPI000AB2284E|nr:hypothetical protein [Caballeronia terrestris]